MSSTRVRQSNCSGSLAGEITERYPRHQHCTYECYGRNSVADVLPRRFRLETVTELLTQYRSLSSLPGRQFGLLIDFITEFYLQVMCARREDRRNQKAVGDRYDLRPMDLW